jgi:hypothetical protein
MLNILDISDSILGIVATPLTFIYLIIEPVISFFKTDLDYIKYVLATFWLSLIFFLLYKRNIKDNKKTLVITLSVILLSVLIIIYHYFLSTRIEPLIYLHNKYSIAYSDIKIIKTTRYSKPFLSLDSTPRSATVIYRDLNTHKDVSIYVYYSGYKKGWTDEYAENTKIKNPLTDPFYQ